MNFIFMAASNTILDASKNAGIGQFLLAVLSFICLAIDSVVYFAITVTYKLFLALAQFEIFNNEAFDYLINRAYIIIGVVSLFVVAYSLLNSIINPDNAGKGNKSFAKIVKNVVIAIVGVAIVPTVFNYFYYFQRVVLCNNFIPRLILQQVNTDTSTLENTATELPELIFESFFYPNGLVADGNSNNDNFTDDLITSEASKIIIGHSNPVYDTDTYSLADAYTNAKNGYSFWTSFEPFIFSSPGVSDNSIQYLIILSTVAGGYIAYVFLNLCLDMGLRAVKLGYLELIAPLAIMTSIVPGQDGIFKSWSKKTISCAVEVFTRLFVVVFAVYLVSTVKNLLQPSFGSTICGLTLNKVYILLLRAIIYCAIFTFAKQAPKFFSEATGIKSDGFKLGIADKLGEMALIGGAAKSGFQRAEGAITGGLGGLSTGLQNRDKVSPWKAFTQGFTQGFDKKGNQFSKQRKATFQKIVGNADKEQGFFGKESLTNRFVNNHKNDVKNSSGEIANIKQHEGQQSAHYQGLKDQFTDDKINNRITEFEGDNLYRQAREHAEEKMRALGTTSQEVRNREIANFLSNAKTYTTDENLKRKISQYENDLDVRDKKNKYKTSQENLIRSAKELESTKTDLTNTRIELNRQNNLVSSKENEIKTESASLNTLQSGLKSAQLDLDSSKVNLDSSKVKMDTAKETMNAEMARMQTLNGDLNTQEADLRAAAKMMKSIVGNRTSVQEPDFEKCSVQELNDYINDCYTDTENDALSSNTREQINKIINRKDAYKKVKDEYDNSKVKFSSAQSEYKSIVDDYNNKEAEYNNKKANYDGINSQVEQKEKQIKTLQETYDGLVKTKLDLEQKEKQIQELARNLHNESNANKSEFDSAKTAYIDSVDKAVEQVYNGDASVRSDGEDDLKHIDDADERNTEQSYRSAKRGITEMGKTPDYNKQIVDALNKLNKDKQ